MADAGGPRDDPGNQVSGKGTWREWGLIAAALGMGLAALLLDERAWRVGREANALGLLGCQFLRGLLLLLAACTAVTVCKAAAGQERAAARGPTVLEVGVILLFVPGCLGCYPVWPVVLFLLVAALFLVLAHRGRGPAWPVTLRLGLVVVLLTLTWYFCASTTRQALRGLAARIEAGGGAGRLRDWAAGVIAARRHREQALPAFGAAAVGWAAAPGQGPFLAAGTILLSQPEDRPRLLAADEVPAWVDDLLGPSQGIRMVAVEDQSDGPSVSLRTGGSGYHFLIQVCPSRGRRAAPPWWLADDAGQPWPGIYLSTEGK